MSESDKKDQDFEQFAREAMVQDSESLPSHIVARIAAARNQALNGAERHRSHTSSSSIWRPALVFGALLLTTAVVMVKLQPANEILQAEAIEDVDILLAQEGKDFQDELDLYDNLEFYAWLENTDEMG